MNELNESTAMAMDDEMRKLLKEFWNKNANLIQASLQALADDGVDGAAETLSSIRDMRDRTKYDFGSRQGLSKRQIKTEIAREYAQMNPKLSSDDFRKDFPKIRVKNVSDGIPQRGYNTKDSISFSDGDFYIDDQGKIDEMDEIKKEVESAIQNKKLKSHLSESE